MIIVLKHNFISEHDIILDALALKNWDSQKELAKYLEIGVSSLERKLRVLKESSSLLIYRYKQNNFIYCIGDDVKNMIDAHIALETAKYRELREDFFFNENDLQEPLSEHQIFDNDETSMINKSLLTNFMPEPKPKQVIFKAMHLDWLAEKIVVIHQLNGLDLDRINEYIEASKFRFNKIFNVK